MGFSSGPGFVHVIFEKHGKEHLETNLNSAETIALVNSDAVNIEDLGGGFLIESKVWTYNPNGNAVLKVKLK